VVVAVDLDHSGRIDAPELQRALAMGGLNLFNVDRTGAVTLQEVHGLVCAGLRGGVRKLQRPVICC